MKGEVSFVRSNGYLVPNGDTVGAKAIARWLGDDIQYSVRDVEEWMEVFSEVAKGNKRGGYQGTGNTHSVMAVGEVVYIECEYVEEQKVFLTQQQIGEVLRRYMDFLKGDYKSSWAVAQPFEIEYEAEGQEALDKYLEIGGSLGV